MRKSEILQLKELLLKFLEEEGDLLIRSDASPGMLITEYRYPKDRELGQKRTLARGLSLDGREDPVEEYLDWKNPYKNEIEPCIYDQNGGVVISERVVPGKRNDEDDFLRMAPSKQAGRIKELEDKLELKNTTISDLQRKYDEKVEEAESFKNQAEVSTENLRTKKSQVQSLSKENAELSRENAILRRQAEKYEELRKRQKGKAEAEIEKAEQRGRDEEKDRLDWWKESQEKMTDIENERLRRQGGRKSEPKIQNLLSEFSNLENRIDEMGDRLESLEERLPA